MQVEISTSEYEKTITVVNLTINGTVIPARVMLSCLDELCGTDGMFSWTNLQEYPDTRQFLVDLKVARKTARGSVYAGENFVEFYEIVMVALGYDKNDWYESTCLEEADFFRWKAVRMQREKDSQNGSENGS